MINLWWKVRFNGQVIGIVPDNVKYNYVEFWRTINGIPRKKDDLIEFILSQQ